MIKEEYIRMYGLYGLTYSGDGFEEESCLIALFDTKELAEEYVTASKLKKTKEAEYWYGDLLIPERVFKKRSLLEDYQDYKINIIEDYSLPINSTFK